MTKTELLQVSTDQRCRFLGFDVELTSLSRRNADYQPNTCHYRALADQTRNGRATSDETLNVEILVERHCETQWLTYVCVCKHPILAF
jgi:hypothetical protein